MMLCMCFYTALFVFFFNQGFVISDCCYDSGTSHCLYCSGYCTGTHGQEICIYNESSLSVGALLGIIIGAVIVLVVIACVSAAVCSSWKKGLNRTRTRRVISPTNLYTAPNTMSQFYTRSQVPDSYRAGAESRASVNRTGAESRASLAIGIPSSWGPPPSYSSIDFGERQNPIPNAVDTTHHTQSRRLESRLS